MNGLKLLIRFMLLFLIFNFSSNAVADNVSEWKLSPDGWGPIHIGMTLKEASKASGKYFTNDKPDPTYEHDSCFYSLFKDENLKDVSLMISDKKIVRIDISSPLFETTKGAHVGDTEAQVISLYGKLRIEAHHYNEKGKYLTYRQGKKRGIRFETNEKKLVTLMYAGRYPEIQFVEGCV